MAFYSPIYLFLLHDRQLERAKSNIDTGNGHMLKITVIHGENHKGSGPFYFFHSHILYESFCPYEIFHWFNIYILDADQPKAYMFHKKAVVISTAAGMGTKKSDKRYINLFVLLRDSKTMGSVFKQKTGGPCVKRKNKNGFYLMGRIQKVGFGSSPVEKQYWKKRLA